MEDTENNLAPAGRPETGIAKHAKGPGALLHGPSPLSGIINGLVGVLVKVICALTEKIQIKSDKRAKIKFFELFIGASELQTWTVLYSSALVPTQLNSYQPFMKDCDLMSIIMLIRLITRDACECHWRKIV